MHLNFLSLAPVVVALVSQLGKAADVVSPRGTLTISNQVLSPDGFNRSAIVVNGVHPGPLIKANKGDGFSLNVVNKLHDPTMLRSTSIHWHGQFQHGTTWADGAASVSQCPIAPGHSFLYQFPSHDQTGTFWYHSHFGTQYCDGLRGPIVIYDQNDPHRHLYDFDDENTVITLADWYHLQAPSIVPPALSNATLINGKGRAPDGPPVPLSIINVIRGKRYRFRLVSLSCDPNYTFSIDGHKLTVIEADGQLTVPLTVESIQIFAGQRYSFVLKADQPEGNYWVRALPNTGHGGLPAGFAGGINSAILRYATVHALEPKSHPQAHPIKLDESALHALLDPPAPGPPTPAAEGIVKLTFELDLRPDGKFTVNNETFEPPPVPVLLQIMRGEKNVSHLMPKGSLFPLPRNETVELKIPGGLRTGPHPFHLHGHAFSVVRSAGSSVYNFENPVRRDVVNIGESGSEVTIRFKTDNPGPWFFHCHIEFHLDAGLAIAFVEDVGNIASSNPVPHSWEELCPIYNALPPSMTSVEIVTLKPTPTAAVKRWIGA